MYFAALRGSTRRVELLLMKGSIIHAMDIHSNTPLHFAFGRIKSLHCSNELFIRGGNVPTKMDIFPHKEYLTFPVTPGVYMDFWNMTKGRVSPLLYSSFISEFLH